MILASLLGIAGDLAVSGLVVTVSAVSRCPFNTSGPYTVSMLNSRPDITIETAPFGASYQMISQARLTSLSNGGLGGIYGKVNGDPAFRADTSDVVGQWKCQDLGDDRSFPMNVSIDDIYSDLDSQGLLFSESSQPCYDHHGDDINGRFLVWSFSAVLSTGMELATPWDSRIAVDITSDAYAASQVFSTYLCSMDAPYLDGILMQTSLDWWLATWCEELRGHIYTDFASAANVSTDPGAVIESVLDNLVMSASSAWNLTQFPISDPTQGCLVTRTNVSWVVVALVFILAIATGVMTGYWIALSASIYVAKGEREDGRQQLKNLEKNTPDGLLGWMLQAMRDTGIVNVRSRDLRDWSIWWHSDGQRMQVIRAPGVGARFRDEELVALRN
jgi:hypothetical protein